MPKLKPALSAKTVEKAKADPARRRELSDGGSGLALIIQPSGAKSWGFRYRDGEGHRRVTLGVYPSVSLGQARDGARAVRERVDAGGAAVVPLIAPPVPLLALPAPAVDQSSTVAAVWADYVAKHLEANAKPGTIARFKGLFEKHVLPGWAARPLADIAKKDCLVVIDAAQARGPEARNSTIVVLSGFLMWALGRDLIVRSPLTGIKKTEEQSRDRILTDVEIGVFWKGCDDLGPIFGPMFQLLLLTGCRRSEVSGMRYDEIDETNRLWTIPGERTKNGLPLAIYLTDQMLAVLNRMPRIQGSPFAFSRYGHSPSSGYSKAKTDLDKLTMGLVDWTLHDLRRTFVSKTKKLGVQGMIVEKCVNHISGEFAGVAGVYDVNDYLEEKMAAWARWNERVAEIVSNGH